jgi:hypothetical protein
MAFSKFYSGARPREVAGAVPSAGGSEATEMPSCSFHQREKYRIAFRRCCGSTARDSPGYRALRTKTAIPFLKTL